MSLGDWVVNTGRRVRSEGITALYDSLRMLYVGSWRVGCSRLPLGTNIYDKNWDVLILLDGCRRDVMESVAPEFEFITKVDEVQSVGSSSREWLAKTFTPSRAPSVTNTVYVTANPYTSDILAPDDQPSNSSPFNPRNWDTLRITDFERVDEVWRDAWDDDLGTVPPRQVTDRAISHGRNRDDGQLIVHYMQPHQPFIGEWALENDLHFKDLNCWGELRRGNVDREATWRAYRENLVSVLEEVELLISCIDAETVAISSDHGNAFGEWGIYGHPNGFLHPVVKRVPWVVTDATNEREYEPEISIKPETDTTTKERLEHLGYM